MRVLVAGAAGFLGSHLVDRLLAEGNEVHALDNLLTGRRENLAHHRGNPHFHWLEADICAPLPALPPLERVYHLASPASPVDYARFPLETLSAGSSGTKNLLELALSDKARFLLASTSEVYGDPEEHPQRESYWGRVNPVGPRSVYDEAKRFAEALTTAYRRTLGVETRIARLFNTYGPRMRHADGRVVPNFTVQALRGVPLTLYGDGLQTRSFCYMSDTIDGIVRLMEGQHPGPINLGNPSEYTMLELAKVLLRLVEQPENLRYLPIPEDDPRVRRPDISLAQAALGWSPKVNLESGLSHTLSWFRAEIEAGRIP